MQLSAPKRYLWIEGSDGKSTLYKARLEAAGFTPGDVKALLRALVAKPAHLSYEEVISTYAERRPDDPIQALPLEELTASFAHGSGDDVTFLACVVDDEDNPFRPGP